MQMCLSHPTEGYYMKGNVFGAHGDFVTSPEISQIFGEVVDHQYILIGTQSDNIIIYLSL